MKNNYVRVHGDNNIKKKNNDQLVTKIFAIQEPFFLWDNHKLGKNNTTSKFTFSVFVKLNNFFDLHILVTQKLGLKKIYVYKK